MRISDWSSDVCSSDLPDSHIHILMDARCYHHLLHRGVDGAGAGEIFGHRIAQRFVPPRWRVREQIRQCPTPMAALNPVPGLERKFGHIRQAGHERTRLTAGIPQAANQRSEEHTYELQSLMRL